jgi:flagellin
MRIGANIPSLRAYAGMSAAYKNLSKSSARLSSGRRINSAADDPAGLSVSDKIRLQVGGLAQASRNASDAVALTQTADGALNEVSAMLQRIRELSVAAANDTNEQSDRQKIQGEIDALISEINDTPLRAEYNGIKIINGECDRIIDESGAESLRISDATPYGDVFFTVDQRALPASAVFTGGLMADPLPALTGKYFLVNGDAVNIAPGETKTSLIDKITALGGLIVTEGAGFDVFGAISTEAVGAGAILTIGGDAAVLAELGVYATETSGVNALISSVGGVLKNPVAYADGDRLTIRATGGAEITADITANNGETATITTERGAITIQAGPDKDMGVYMSIPRVNAETTEIEKAATLDSRQATDAILRADKAIGIVSETRARVGAYQNRLEHTINNLDNAYVNAAYALSRVRDADIAAEMGEYAKDSVIYQAGISMMAQSNARAQAVLQLLQ